MEGLTCAGRWRVSTKYYLLGLQCVGEDIEELWVALLVRSLDWLTK